MESGTGLFQKQRPELINIAYGMLGELSEARDVVQEAYVRWSKVDLDEVRNPESYLKSIVSRLCIDRFRSARSRREEYIGPWLPQPVVDTDTPLPDTDVELNERLSLALLHLLETLSPEQRAVYLLHDIFGYPLDEVAGLLNKKPATCRKIAQRTRSKVHSDSVVETSGSITVSSERKTSVDRFITAIQHRDIQTLERLLTEDVVLYSDGGGKAQAARKPLAGLQTVINFLTGIANKHEGSYTIEPATVNSRPGFKAYINGELHSIWTFGLRDDGKMDRIFAVLNPEKMRYGE